MAMSKKIKLGDTVIIKDGIHAGSYGVVMGCQKKEFLVDPTYEGDPVKAEPFAPDSLSSVPPILLDEKELRELCRFEKTPLELKGNMRWSDLETKSHYQMGLQDLKAALANVLAHGGPDTQDALEWYAETFLDFSDALGVWDYLDFLVEPDPDEPEPIEGLPSAPVIFGDIHDELVKRYELKESSASFEDMLGWIDAYLKERSLPLAERGYTEEQKKSFLSYWDAEAVEESGNPDITAFFVKTVNELADAGDPVGLDQKAYACYGNGSAGFKQDWEASRDCLLKLEEISPSATYANTLGYLYYYGRCNDGKPEYDKAFYWFSIGAAGDVYESRYKLADMFRDGKGCPKDPELAHSIVMELFNDNLPYFCQGVSLSKFADVALRAGNLERDGIGCTPTKEEAYSYYLMAKLAIRMRRQADDYYGDDVVEDHIDEGIGQVLPGSRYAEKQDALEFDEGGLPRLLHFALLSGNCLEMDYEWKDVDKGRLALTFHIKQRPDATHAAKLPLLLPEAHFCGLVEELSVKAKVRQKDAKGLKGKKGTICFDGIDYETPWFRTFTLYGEKQAAVHGTFSIDATKLAGKKRRYASVSFGDADHSWDYLAEDDSIVPGDKVLVPWAKDEREATVIRICTRRDSEMVLFRDEYRKVLKKIGPSK